MAGALSRHPVVTDPSMQALRGAAVGEPVLAHSPQGAPAFWLVPLLSGPRACGFSRVGLDGRIAQMGSFGAGGHDVAAWPEADFFRQPPLRVLDEVRTRHLGAPLAEPVFAYDGSPARWGWCIAVGEPASSVVYITPGGWYEKPPERAVPPAREG